MQKLYIIHGWTYSLDSWATVCELLRQKDIEPVQLKVPGLTEPSNEVWDIDGYVEWLHTVLKDEPNPSVLGHSNGGRIALWYAARHKSLKQLILLDSAGIPHHGKRRAAVRVLAKVASPLKHIPLAKKVVYHVLGAQDYNNALPNMKHTMHNLLEADERLDLGKVHLPTTIIWGANDTVTPLGDAQKLHRSIAGSTLHVIDGARHAPHATHATQLVDLIAAAMRGKA